MNEPITYSQHHRTWLQPGMAGLQLAALVLLGLCLPAPLRAQDPWCTALARMPLAGTIPELNRTNCVQVMLAAFQADPVVKALVFMPGATDELYLFRRARAVLTNTAPTLLDAVTALTNQTLIQATFHSPFLLLHNKEDFLDPDNQVQDDPTARKLERLRLSRMACSDWDWDALEPVLKHGLRLALRPWRYSTDSWHFYRHSFAAWNVNGLQALQITALAGKSRFVLRHREATFLVDTRVRGASAYNRASR